MITVIDKADKKVKKTIGVLSNLDIDTISLVNSPANMTPVKLIKGDNMVENKTEDFSEITIYSVTIAKSDESKDFDLESFGITDKTKQTVIKKDSKPFTKYQISKADKDEETIEVPLSQGVTVEVSKMLMDYVGVETAKANDISIYGLLAAQSFMPNVYEAMSNAYYIIYDVMDSAKPNSIPSKEVSQVLSALKKYVMLLVSILPSEVIKMDKKVEEKVDAKVDEAADAKTEEVIEKADAKETDTKETDAKETKVEKTDEKVESEVKETEVEKADEEIKEDEGVTLEGLAEQLNGLTDIVSGLADVVKKDKEETQEKVSKMDELAQKVASLNEKVEKADSTVAVDTDGEVEEIEKSDNAQPKSVWAGLF